MPGSAAVLQGCNGSVYGWLPSGENGDGRWYWLGEHGAEPVPAEEVGPSLYKEQVTTSCIWTLTVAERC